MLAFEVLSIHLRAQYLRKLLKQEKRVAAVCMVTCHGIDTLIILLSAEDTNGLIQADHQLSDCDRVPLVLAPWSIAPKSRLSAVTSS